MTSSIHTSNPDTRMHRPLLRRMATVSAAAVTGVLALPGLAQAHVTVQPGDVEGGGFSVVAFRVPNERDDASTTRLRVLLPEDQPIGFVQTTPVPGWKVSTRNRTLDEPIELFGEQVDTVVGEITWTATGDGIAPGQFQDFDISLGPLPESGEMVFRALQTYSSGERVNWNQVAVDESVEPEHPAPVLTIAAAETEDSHEDGAASTTGGVDQASDETESLIQTADAEADDDSSSVLALTLAGGALLFSLVAVGLAWRRRA